MREINRKFKGEIYKQYDTLADYARDLNIQPSRLSRVIRGFEVLQPDEKKEWAAKLGRRPKDLFNE